MDPKETNAGSPAPGATTPAMASASIPAKAGNVAAATSAYKSMPRFGGNRGGRARADGLTPGSPEAAEADRKKDADRKAAARNEAAKLLEPAPLPSAAPGVSSPGTPQAAGLGTGSPAQIVEVIPWDAETLAPLFEETIDAAQAKRIKKLSEAAKEAGLGQKVAQEIAKDAEYPTAAKTALNRSGPKAVAKLLNRTGISGKYSDEGLALFGLVSIFLQGHRLEAKLDALVAEAKRLREEQEKQRQEKKP
jgi:uncharacterized protein YidB (DUF937 family)